MAKIFYLFRHGETDYNVEKRWQGCSVDSLLNQNGLRQALELAGKLKSYGISKIYTSSLRRAIQTSTIVASQLDVPLEVVSELREGNLGLAEGLQYQEVKEAFPDIFEAWYSPENDMSVSFPSGETKLQMQERMFLVFEHLLEDTNEIIGICSHGGSIRYLLMKFGIPPHRIPNIALYRIIYDNDSWSAEILFNR